MLVGLPLLVKVAAIFITKVYIKSFGSFAPNYYLCSMELDNTNQVLRNQAIRDGLCQKWQNEVWNRNMSTDELVDMFYRGIDFAIEHHYPDKGTLLTLFGVRMLREYAVLVDDHFSLLNPEHAILIGDSTTNARYNGHIVAELYLTDNSTADVYAREKAHVIVHLYGQSSVRIHSFDSSDVLAVRHSVDASCSIEEGEARIKYEKA